MLIPDEKQKMLVRLQQLEAREAFHSQTLADILAFSTRLTRNSDLKTLYSDSNALALRILKLDFSTLMILSDDDKALFIRDTIGFPSSMIDSFSLLEGQGLSTFVVKEKKAAIVQNFQTEKRFEIPPVVLKENIISAIAVPMLLGDTVFGVLIGHTKTERIFTPEEINLYQSIANQSAVAIKNLMHLESLEDSEARFRLLMDSMDAFVYVADMDTHEVLFINEYGKRMMGDVTGKVCWQSMQKGQNGPCPFCTNKYLLDEEGKPGKMYTWEFQNTVTGRWFYKNDRAIKWPDGRIVRLEIATDISERKQLENTLQKAKEEWTKTFDAMSDIVTIQNKNMEIVRANKAAHDYFQRPLGGFIGQKCFEIFRGSSQPCTGCPGLKTLKTIRCHSEIIQHEKLGKVFHVSSAPILDENNEIEFLIHIAKDITEQKRLEEELFQAHKMEAIGTMAGGIAHDFNNILSAIMGFSELAKQDLPENSSARNDIDQVLKSSRRAADLVQQILTFSRKSEHHLQSLNPHLVVKEALRMLGSSLPSSITIYDDIDKGCGQILADPTNIHQIMINLCINALHAMENQKGTLTVKLYRKEIAAEEIPPESGVFAGPFIILSVSDTGHGMDEATKKRIFDPYFTTKETGKGSGIGLAIIHGIIHDYKGFVKVDSKLGEGSTFSVYIPALQKEAINHEDSASIEIENEPFLSTGNKRILIVDDEPLLVQINKRRLETLGCIVTAKTDSQDALKEFRANPDQFDLLITDQTMPGLTGGELAKKILEIKPSMPIIMCTGHSEIVSKNDALAMGIKKYVFKPIQGDELVNAVREVLNGK